MTPVTAAETAHPYRWSWSREIVLALVTAALMLIFQVAINFDPLQIADWHVWLISTAGALTRAIGAAGVNVLAGLIARPA